MTQDELEGSSNQGVYLHSRSDCEVPVSVARTTGISYLTLGELSINMFGKTR